MHLDYRTGGLAPYGGIGHAIPVYPRLAREIRLDTAGFALFNGGGTAAQQGGQFSLRPPNM